MATVKLNSDVSYSGSFNVTGSLLIGGQSITAINTGSFATTGSNTFRANQVISGSATNSLVVRGSGTTSTTTTVRVENSAGTESLTIADNGNTAFNTDDLFISSSGNIGINTLSPQYRMQVNGSGSTNTNLPLALTTVDSSNRNGILFASSSIASGRQHRLFHRTNTPNAEWILGANAGETATWNFVPLDDTNFGVAFQVPRNGGTTQITTGISQSLLSIRPGGTNALNISSSGFIGVGTAVVQATGNLIAARKDQDGPTSISVINASNTTSSRSAVGVGVPGLAISMIAYPVSQSNTRLREKGVILTDTGVLNGIGVYTTTGSIEIAAKFASNLNQLVISDNGNVGIATPTPSFRLDVSGSGRFTNELTVTGSLIAPTITGSLSGTASFATSASFATTASFALNAGGGVTINNNTDNFIVTATGTANTLNGEANLTFSGTKLTVAGDVDITGTNSSNATSGLLVKDNNSATTFDVRNDGELKISTAKYPSNGVLENNNGNIQEIIGWTGNININTTPPITISVQNGVITNVI